MSEPQYTTTDLIYAIQRDGGRKVEAIKQFRETAGCDLVTAKNYVEGLPKAADLARLLNAPYILELTDFAVQQVKEVAQLRYTTISQDQYSHTSNERWEAKEEAARLRNQLYALQRDLDDAKVDYAKLQAAQERIHVLEHFITEVALATASD